MILPGISATARSETGIRIDLQIDSDLPYFRGHFPGMPVLPGVVQIGWALALGHEHLGCPTNAAALKKIKFNRVIAPGGTACLALDFDNTRGYLSFRYEDAAGVASSGVIELEQP